MHLKHCSRLVREIGVVGLIIAVPLLSELAKGHSLHLVFDAFMALMHGAVVDVTTAEVMVVLMLKAFGVGD